MGGIDREKLAAAARRKFNPWHKRMLNKLLGRKNLEVVLAFDDAEWKPDKPCLQCGLNMGGRYVGHFECLVSLGGCGYSESPAPQTQTDDTRPARS